MKTKINTDFVQIDYDILHQEINGDKDFLIYIPMMRGNTNTMDSIVNTYSFTVPSDAVKDFYFLVFVKGTIIINAPQQISFELIEEIEVPILHKSGKKIQIGTTRGYQIVIKKNEVYYFTKGDNQTLRWS